MVMKQPFPLFLCLVLLLLGGSTGRPCTTFVAEGKGRLYFGRNLDWHWEDGLVVVNRRGVHKRAFVMVDRSPAQWTAKYGSVTFNQFGVGMPYGGMNEAGLVVENMWLDETDYAVPDARSAVNLLGWIQYQLDTCATVAEVVATESKVRIESTPPSMRLQPRVHYLVCDAKGEVATIEFLGGKMVVHRGEGLPCRALANTTYQDSMDFLRQHPDLKQPGEKAKNDGSVFRFCQAAARAEAFKPSNAKKELRYCFDTLDQVHQGDFTVWRVVYDVAHRKIHFCTRGNAEVRTVEFKRLKFNASGPGWFVDMQSSPVKGRLVFQELTEARHRSYLTTFFAQPSVKGTMGDLTPLVEGLLQNVRGQTDAR